MDKKYWIRIILLGFVCGILLGACMYAAQTAVKEWNEVRGGEADTETETREPAEPDSAESETETQSSAVQSESETPVPAENVRTDLNGSYACAGGYSVTIRLTDISGPERYIGNYAVIYIDREKEQDGQLWGHTSYCGLDGWIRMDELTLLSAQDYSLQAGGSCEVISIGTENNFSYKASNDVTLLSSIPFGTQLTISEFGESGGRTVYDGKDGWIARECISVFRQELPYTVNAGYEAGVFVYEQPSFSGEVCGELSNGAVIRMTEFRQGWGKITVGEATGWVPFTDDLCPVNENTAVTEPSSGLLNMYQETETETEPFETDFYTDGTHNPKNGYILPESSSQYLDSGDLSNLTLKGICYAKNEIYARYGRKFKSKELQRYFNSQPWYNGVLEASTETDNYIVSQMNKYELANKDFLYSEEARLGMYSLDQ